MKNSLNSDIDVEGDDTDQIQAKIIALASTQLMARNRDKIYQIDNALKKINEGTFGKCEECEEEISEKRLLINPWFITCISCAEHIEMENKRNRR